MARSMIDAETLRRVLRYDPETGVFRWRGWARNNCISPGTIAGSVQRGRSTDYWVISYKCRNYKAHRLAFLYMLGRWPQGEVDHIDGDGLNNAWANLREATVSQNQANSRPRRHTATGLKGAYRNGKRFSSHIRFEGTVAYLGTFDTPEEAHAAYCTAARRYFGEFARVEEHRQ